MFLAPMLQEPPIAAEIRARFRAPNQRTLRMHRRPEVFLPSALLHADLVLVALLGELFVVRLH